MKKNHYYNKSLVIVLLTTVFFTVFSCSHEDSEDDKVPAPENKIGLVNPPTIANINVAPNNNTTEDTSTTEDTNTTEDINTTENITNTAEDTNPPSYNLAQAQSFMHWLNPNDTCSVGWDINPYKQLRSKTCGIESERHECKSCRHPSFGVESDKTIKKFAIRRDFHKINPKDTDITGTCSSHIYEIRSEFQKGNASNTSTYADFVGGYYTNGAFMAHTQVKPGLVAICYYSIEVKELLYKEAKNCNVCGSIDEVIYKLCKHPSNGIEEIISKSSIDLSKKDVERLEGKVLSCKTCDDIKFDILNMDEENDIQLVNRINCLLNNLDSSDINNEDKQGIIIELKRLTIYSDLINKNHPELFTKIKEHI